jgi:hypothetical protein
MFREGCGVKSLSMPFSALIEFREDSEDWLPAFSILEGGPDGDPTGVWDGELV